MKHGSWGGETLRRGLARTEAELRRERRCDVCGSSEAPVVWTHRNKKWYCSHECWLKREST